MAQYINPESNISYTEKDFQSIYPELLNLVKKLTYRWDPSISDESDPGVILLKLNAIIADKLDYNIDKNVLETMPLSVTQEPNARQLFEQLGYFMRWYRSANTNVVMKWIGEISNDISYTIPRFTTISSDGNETLYTLTEEKSIKCDGSVVSFNAIQGVAKTYEINGNTTINVSNLDSNNRLYFDDYNIAENGIFITNVDRINYSDWKKVNNIIVQDIGTPCYRFGVTQKGNRCYIEFPEDAEDLFGEGIQVTYIKTDGEDGIVKASVLDNFYNEISVTNPQTNLPVILNSENVSITNPNASTFGYNPETIDEAYENYKKTVGTFETLVTIRDYINAIIVLGRENKQISNAFVCDRTNDIQNSYYVVHSDGDLTVHDLVVEEESSTPKMSAFDLKMYLLAYSPNPLNANGFNRTFEIVKNVSGGDETTVMAIRSLIADTKSLQHDFQYLDKEKICFIKNKYPIKCTIIPQYRVTDLQANEISVNVQTALCDKFNSSKINFGDEIEYDDVYDTILNSDNRIKTIILDYINYKTYAVYIKNDANSTIVEVPINDIGTQINGYKINGEFYTEPEGTTTPISHSAYDTYFNITDTKYYRYDTTLNAYVESIIPTIQSDIYAKSVLNGNTQLLTHNTTFDYTLNEINPLSDEAAINDVVSITTEVEINASVEDGEAHIDIEPNENILLSVPNLIDTETFSTYVKILYKVDRDVESDTDYTLGANECVAMFWQSVDDDSAPYNYAKFKEGEIIKPIGFALRTSDNTTNEITNPTSTSIPSGRGSTYGKTIIIDGTTVPLSTYIKGLVQSKYVLTTKKQLIIRNLNQVKITNISPVKYCYWILNKKTDVGNNKVYRLFDENETTYDLSDGEYLLYTNENADDLFILGSGTRLSRSASVADTIWQVSVFEGDTSSIMADGTNALDGYWFNIGAKLNNNDEFNAIEMQFISLGNGITFNMESDQITSSTSISIDSNGITITPDIPLDEITMSYTENGTTTPIPSVNIGGETWDIRTLLNLKLSSKTPLVLGSSHEQTLTFTRDDGTTFEVGSAQAVGQFPPSILSDRNVDMVGGSNIDVTALKPNGEYVPLKVYVYTTIPPTVDGGDDEDDIIRIGADGTVLINAIASGTHTYEFSSMLPVGDYVIPLQVPNNVTQAYMGVTIEDTDYPIGTMIDDSTETYHQATIGGTTYYKYHSDGETSVTIFVSITTSVASIITIKPIVQYSAPHIVDNEQDNEYLFESLIKTVNKLDRNNRYDWTYVVDDDEKIENPLEAISFFDAHHIMNRYTICQLDTNSFGDKGTIKVTQKVK